MHERLLNIVKQSQIGERERCSVRLSSHGQCGHEKEKMHFRAEDLCPNPTGPDGTRRVRSGSGLIYIILCGLGPGSGLRSGLRGKRAVMWCVPISARKMRKWMLSRYNGGLPLAITFWLHQQLKQSLSFDHVYNENNEPVGYIAGRTISERRNSLKTSTVDSIIFLHKNM